MDLIIKNMQNEFCTPLFKNLKMKTYTNSKQNKQRNISSGQIIDIKIFLEEAKKEIARGDFQYLNGRDGLIAFRQSTNYSYRITKGERYGERVRGVFYIIASNDKVFKERIGCN